MNDANLGAILKLVPDYYRNSGNVFTGWESKPGATPKLVWGCKNSGSQGNEINMVTNRNLASDYNTPKQVWVWHPALHHFDLTFLHSTTDYSSSSLMSPPPEFE
jgi:hypothetical protein